MEALVVEHRCLLGKDQSGIRISIVSAGLISFAEKFMNIALQKIFTKQFQPDK